MRSILLGHDAQSGEEVRIPYAAFPTHFHLIGGTGKGKTTAIHTLLHRMLTDPIEPACFIIIDRLGNFSQELLLWMASEEFCTDDVRERLVYVQPAREDVVLPFNPLVYDTPAHGYYRVERATEIILRAWESVNIEAMPRLARWTFNAFWAAAQLGLTISDCVHFLMPGSEFHTPLLQLLPPRLQAEWREISTSRSGEALRILDSSRNRLRPYFDSDILRRMFGSTHSRLDIHRFMAEGKIVIVDLAPRNRLGTQLANTIGSLLINEVLAVARSLPMDVRYPTYLLLDEFQNFVGPDIEAAVPEVRQLGLRLILSHQSFAQLKRPEGIDLSTMIFQAQSRMIFGVQGEDADLLANEVASVKFDPKAIKDELYSRRQRVSGHGIMELQSSSEADGSSGGESLSRGKSSSHQTNRTERKDGSEVRGDGDSSTHNDGRSDSWSTSHTATHGTHQTLVPEYEEFLELTNRTYKTFEEQRSEWAKAIRNLPKGHALLRLVDEPDIRTVKVKRTAPGFLKHDPQTIARLFPEAVEAMERLIESNFQSGLFMPADAVDREADERLRRVLNPPIAIPLSASSDFSALEDPQSLQQPFA